MQDKWGVITPDTTVSELIVGTINQFKKNGLNASEFDIPGTLYGENVVINVKVKIQKVGNS